MVYQSPAQAYFHQKDTIEMILTIINHVMNHYFTTIDHIKHHKNGGYSPINGLYFENPLAASGKLHLRPSP